MSAPVMIIRPEPPYPVTQEPRLLKPTSPGSNSAPARATRQDNNRENDTIPLPEAAEASRVKGQGQSYEAQNDHPGQERQTEQIDSRQ